MTLGQPDPCVAIAGDGIAASALATVLRARGFGVVMLAPRTRRTVPVVESIPATTAELLLEIGLGPALHAASPVPVTGMVNRFSTDPELVAGQWIHLDRAALAANALTQARRAGATLLREATTPSAVTTGADGIEIRTRTGVLQVRAAVDATGRAAVWSRPVTHTASATAAVHRGPPQRSGAPAVISPVPDGWAYLLSHPGGSSLGLIRQSSTRLYPVDDEVAALLDIAPAADWQRVAVRNVGVQWCTQPVRARRLAIGDAALACSPLAGHGVKFAVASALAAAAVLTTWYDGSATDRATADGYYRDMVQRARIRHLDHLDQLTGAVAAPPPTRDTVDSPDHRVRFCAAQTVVGQNRAGRIVAAEAFVLSDGDAARSVSGLDLAWLREVCAGQPTVAQMHAALVDHGLPGDDAANVIGWALANGVVEHVN